MKQLIENKKGIALNQGFGAVLVLVLIGVLVIVGILVFVNLESTFVDLDTVNVVEETITDFNTTAVFVAQSPTSNSDLCNYRSFELSAKNATVSVYPIDPANYTVTQTGSIVVSFDVDENLNASSGIDGWNVSYNASTGGASCTASNDMIEQFATYPILIGLIGTIIFLGLVIGVLVASFVFGRKEGF